MSRSIRLGWSAHAPSLQCRPIWMQNPLDADPPRSDPLDADPPDADPMDADPPMNTMTDRQV